MEKNWIYPSTPLSLVVGLPAFVGTGAVSVWAWLADSISAQVMVAAAVLILAAVFGILWQSRARAARRLRAALDAFAEREMARARRRNPPKTTRTLSARGGVLQSRRPAKPIHLHS